jgi:hypothetical protein
MTGSMRLYYEGPVARRSRLMYDAGTRVLHILRCDNALVRPAIGLESIACPCVSPTFDLHAALCARKHANYRIGQLFALTETFHAQILCMNSNTMPYSSLTRSVTTTEQLSRTAFLRQVSLVHLQPERPHIAPSYLQAAQALPQYLLEF